MKSTNLTVRIDEIVLRRARIRALERGTTVNTIVREYLADYAGDANEALAATRRLVELSKQTGSGREDATWTRDDLHERLAN